MSTSGSSRSVSLAESTATKVVQNTSILLIGRIANALLGAASSVLIVRCLGSEQFGEFSSFYAYATLFAWLATLGIEPVLTRESARCRERAGSIMATGIALCCAFAAITSVFAILLAPHVGFRGGMQLLVVFAAIELLGFAPLRLAGAIFQVDLRQWYGTGINLARQVLWLLVVIVLAKTGGSLTSFVVGRLSVAFVETVLLLVVSAKFLARPRRIIVQDLRPYLRACAPIALSTLLASVYLRIDQVMLHNMASDKILGFYAAAVKVSELFEMFPAALLSSLFPILAVAASDGQRMAIYEDRVFRYIMAAAGLLCTVISVGAAPVIRILYGRQFAPSAHILSILIWSEFAVFFGAAIANLLLAKGLQTYLLFPTIGGAVFNIALNYVWIPRYEAVGSAWATVVSYTFAWAIVLLGFPDTRAMMWHGLRKGIPVVLVSSVGAVLAGSLPLSPVFRLVTALVLYGAGVSLMRTIRSADLQYLRAAWHQTVWRRA